MLSATLIAVALLLGYLVAVGLSMMVAFGVAKAAPQFVVKDHLVRIRYKLLEELVWLVCVTAGSYLSALVANLATRPALIGALLALILILVLWANRWETRQRGLGHQLLMSAVSVAGVAAGYYLALSS